MNNISTFPLKAAIKRDLEAGLFKDVMALVEATACFLEDPDTGKGASALPQEIRGQYSATSMMLTCFLLDMASIVLVARAWADEDGMQFQVARISERVRVVKSLAEFTVRSEDEPAPFGGLAKLWNQAIALRPQVEGLRLRLVRAVELAA